ncbi:MAG: YdjY domain-containing protein [Akkermansiaceae bacterium]
MKNRISTHLRLLPKVAAAVLAFALCFSFSALAEQTEKPAAEKTDAAEVELNAKGDQLKLPGLTVQVKERYVDVDAKVCLTGGMLELIACTKGSKEHESIIAVEAKAAHIHAALLLIQARPGNPAMRKQIEGEEGGWVNYPPRGAKIDVSLVLDDENGKKVERPISDFLIKGDDGFGSLNEDEDAERERFPTKTFLFAGSHVFKDGKNEPRYLADESGNVISIATFGDELLCLPGMHGHANEGLVWEIDSTHLPKLGADVKLRLRPHGPKVPDAEKSKDKTTE